jgi:predicted SnoaL-like aldol condensation-catalyzing enzyme
MWKIVLAVAVASLICAAPALAGNTAQEEANKKVDGAEGFKAFIEFLKAKFPNYHSEVKRVFADGDYVILHVHNVAEPGQRGAAIVDIFKLENGKVVEHWDVRQDIPEKSANANTMF